MTNILIVGERIPSYEMTTIAFNRFSEKLPINVRSVLTRYVSRKDLKWCDVCICIRGNNPLNLYTCKIAKKAGCKIILMLDDDLIAYKSSHHPLYEKLCKKSLISIIELSDFILTPSPYLGNKYGNTFNKPYKVIDTIISNNDFKSNWVNSDRIRLLYAASHMESFEQLICPILNKLNKKYPNKITITIIGGKPDLTLVNMPIKYIPSMPYARYREYMNTESFDIAFAPLIENEMTKSKYYNKYLEYSTQGICGIYSNTLPYTSIIRESENGLLARNYPQDWLNAICKLIDNPDIRSKCVTTAQFEIKNKFSIDNITLSLSEIPLLHYNKKQESLQRSFIVLSYPFFLLQETLRRFLKILVKLNLFVDKITKKSPI